MKKMGLLLLAACLLSNCALAGDPAPRGMSLAVPAVGFHRLRILSPDVLELTRITTAPHGGRPEAWDFSRSGVPASDQFTVEAGGGRLPVSAVGFKQRPYYAPDRHYNLRILACVYLRLAQPVPPGATVAVAAPGGMRFEAVRDPLRFSPVVHVNQEGYETGTPKQAMVGYYLGSLGEMPIPERAGYSTVDAAGHAVTHGPLRRRPELEPGPGTEDREVYEADFSTFHTPGMWRVQVPGLGTSLPFRVDDGAAANYARAFALGLYHQTCGAALELPFTRFTHAACHLAEVQIPDDHFKAVNEILAKWARDTDRYQTAPRLDRMSASLYPWQKSGRIDAHGGYHDAGDYSKYTVTAAQLIHALVFAADNFPGVGALDNLGLPCSGDGKSDLLEMAQWEADFLTRIQDSDGGLAFLVYPRDGAYEWNATPDRGWPQVVYPKNTTATAAAVAALAQCATSPLMRREFPRAADRYAAAARGGWGFLQRAWARYGRRGAYQKIHHYGITFADRDEIAWAEVEMYLLSRQGGDAGSDLRQMLRRDFDPLSPASQRWGWWRCYASYGCAARDYAFAARRGRVLRSALDGGLLSACETEVRAAGQDALRWTQASAYDVAYAFPDKRSGNASWYSPSAWSFDMAAADLLHPDRGYLAAVLGNVDYELGDNPVNRCYVTGQGWRRQHEIVSQWEKNGFRAFPPSGIPIGSPAATVPYPGTYGGMLRELEFPPDKGSDPYPIYDRWMDTWNVSNEIVCWQQARALAATAWLMAQTPLRDQAWRAAPARITGVPEVAAAGRAITATLRVPGIPEAPERVVWEVAGSAPRMGGATIALTPPKARGRGNEASWIEAEAQWPDGRRAFARVELKVGEWVR